MQSCIADSQVLGVARRHPEQLRRFMVTRDAALTAECLVLPLGSALHAAATRSGATQLSPGFVQDAVHAAAATVAAYGAVLIDRRAPAVPGSILLQFVSTLRA